MCVSFSLRGGELQGKREREWVKKMVKMVRECRVWSQFKFSFLHYNFNYFYGRDIKIDLEISQC